MNTETPSKEEVTEFQQTLLKMNRKTFDLYKQIAEILTASLAGPANYDDSSKVMEKQKQFVRQTAGKIRIDEDAINELRTRSMI